MLRHLTEQVWEISVWYMPGMSYY